MEDKPDWANISGDEEDDREEEQQESGQGERNESQPGQPYQQRPPYNNRGGSRGGRGGRGQRGGPRGGQRGGPRGDTRGEPRGEYRGEPRGEYRGDRGDRPKVKESQPAQEMIGLIKRGRDENPLINLFDVDYKATEEDIKKVYSDIQIENINMIKPGLFLLELNREEALKLVDVGPKTVFNRPFFMKLGYSNKKQNPEEQWHTVNSEKHKREVGHREDRQPKGKRPNYNRKEQDDFEEPPRPFHQKQNRGGFENRNRNQEPVEMDPENKFFKGHDLTSNEFKIKFTNSSSKREEGTETTQSSNKPNPFGEAKARDESDYLKKKELEDEKDQVKDLQEHFEEKKDQLKDNKKGLPTPVNSPNTEFFEESDKKNEGKNAPPGISAGNRNKKSGFTGRNQQGGYDRNVERQEAPEQKPKDEGKTVSNKQSNKFNQFAFLE